jgi:sugar-specific transcriptional regulator TrmB
MADDSEFITKLIGFGLSEKEAQVYLHLLKYRPKPPSLLAKSLKTYREDVYRTLTGLIDKGMVNPSLETPTVYAAVELDVALEAALKKHETELRQMEIRKRELEELSQQQRFRPSDEFVTYKILKNVKEATATIISLVNSLEERYLWVAPWSTLVVGSLFGMADAAKEAMERGIHARGICDVTYPIIELVQQLLDMGQDVRHYDQYSGIYLGVFDSKSSMSSINVDITRMSLDEPLSVLWTDDPTYAEYLAATFELLWEQAVPAAQRIEELLKEGPPKV